LRYCIVAVSGQIFSYQKVLQSGTAAHLLLDLLTLFHCNNKSPALSFMGIRKYYKKVYLKFEGQLFSIIKKLGPYIVKYLIKFIMKIKSIILQKLTEIEEEILENEKLYEDKIINEKEYIRKQLKLLDELNLYQEKLENIHLPRFKNIVYWLRKILKIKPKAKNNRRK